MKTDELREAYLDFFVTKGCVRKPSDVLVPDDPTVLFTPAGMNQFKREFLGLGDPSFTRATTCQKCLRTGDIENVGRTAFHETLFEMLGNFSFGDYFKREAIHWAWEFLVKVLRIDPARLSITVYLDDDEAFDIWEKEIGVSRDRISRLGEDDNFWPAGAPTHGPNGVCGPCSEIFYHGDGPKEVEIWNLVFTQFNRTGVNALEPLPKKNIDTGMGLERAAACLQGVSTVFDTDIFRPIVAAAAELLGVVYDPSGGDGVRIRRMSDHSRALTFAIHENVRPGPQKQGYVIRRLLRRGVLDAYMTGRREPILADLVPVVVDVMKKPYPELAETCRHVQNVVRDEEERFLANLENSLKYLNDTFKRTKAAGSAVVAGRDAFDLHSTYGIPVEITASLAAENDLSVDMSGFDAAMKDFAELTRGTSEAAAVFTAGPLDALKRDYHSGNAFLGYETTAADAAVIAVVSQDRLVDRAGTMKETDPPIALVLDQTPFYGESGGQVGDTGIIENDAFLFRVIDTQKENVFTLHIGRIERGEITVGGSVRAAVDTERREAIRRAHSATHVLHHALQTHLGKHARQAGSKVEPDRLRFDFANAEAVGKDRLRAIEQTVNELVLRGDAVSWSIMPIERARELGATALFGEKYPERVRVVRMGDYSLELCGGTHLDNVGKAGLFKIVGEESVSAGTRRITALTGRAALDHVRQEEETLAAAAAALRVSPAQIPVRVQALLDEIKSLKKQASKVKSETAPKVSTDDLLARAEKKNGVSIVVAAVDATSPDDLRQMVDVLRRKAGSGLAALLISAVDGKVYLVAGMTSDVTDRGLHAGLWLKEVAPIVGGGGGGRPDMAQAGGKDPARIADAVRKAIESIDAKVNDLKR